jgi:predicted Fe-Mo cluster-binding NifX family protein
MKIAVPSQNHGAELSQHFGHCESFTIYADDGSGPVRNEVVPNPGHRPGYLPLFLRDLGCDVVVAGGMGEAAIRIFEANGISVVLGASGSADAAVLAFVRGELGSSGEACHAHEHGDGHHHH